MHMQCDLLKFLPSECEHWQASAWHWLSTRRALIKQTSKSSRSDMAHLPLHLLAVIKIIIDINISLKEILDFLILLLGEKNTCIYLY